MRAGRDRQPDGHGGWGGWGRGRALRLRVLKSTASVFIITLLLLLPGAAAPRMLARCRPPLRRRFLKRCSRLTESPSCSHVLQGAAVGLSFIFIVSTNMMACQRIDRSNRTRARERREEIFDSIPRGLSRESPACWRLENRQEDRTPGVTPGVTPPRASTESIQPSGHQSAACSKVE